MTFTFRVVNLNEYASTTSMLAAARAGDIDRLVDLRHRALARLASGVLEREASSALAESWRILLDTEPKSSSQWLALRYCVVSLLAFPDYQSSEYAPQPTSANLVVLGDRDGWLYRDLTTAHPEVHLMLTERFLSSPEPFGPESSLILLSEDEQLLLLSALSDFQTPSSDAMLKAKRLVHLISSCLSDPTRSTAVIA